MTDSATKIIGARGTIQVPAELSREIVIAAKQWGTTSHRLVAEAWELLKAARDQGGAPVQVRTRKRRKTLEIPDEMEGIVEFILSLRDHAKSDPKAEASWNLIMALAKQAAIEKKE